MNDLKPEDIQVGHTYEAKRPKRVFDFGDDLVNDRTVLWIGGALEKQVQYDSPSISDGRHYPRVSIEKFLNWAGRDVTALMPKDRWRQWANRKAEAAISRESTKGQL